MYERIRTALTESLAKSNAAFASALQVRNAVRPQIKSIVSNLLGSLVIYLQHCMIHKSAYEDCS